MAGLLRGDVRFCDFGDRLGHELSGRRYGLVLSEASFNNRFRVAIVAPMTTSLPEPPHRWHIPVGPEGAWAVVRQLRTVRDSRLGRVSYAASSDEMDEVALAIHRFLGESFPVGGRWPVRPGGVYRAIIPGLDSGVYESDVVVLDYSPGNSMAIVMAVAAGAVGYSELKVPFQLDGDDRLWFVRVHRVCTVSERRLREFRGLVNAGVMNLVQAMFKLMVL